MATKAGPTPTAPEGGWKTATTTANKKADKALEFAKGIDATQGHFYRHQQGCLAYIFGLSSADTILGTAIWSSKELFYSLPKNPRDLEKLNEARAPYKTLVEDMRITETNVVFGVGHKKHPDDGAGESERDDFKWNEVMGTYGRRNVVPNVPKGNAYVVHVEMKTKPGKGEEVAKGLEATQGRFYRTCTQPGCHAYQLGLSANDEDMVSFIFGRPI